MEMDGRFTWRRQKVIEIVRIAGKTKSDGKGLGCKKFG